jgi:hypothetical protein
MELLNDAERFLLNHWSEARMLEESMEGVRTKYKEVFQKLVEAVSEAHPELDASSVWVTQFWSRGSIVFGRRTWPVENSYWPCGFWIEPLRLENLSSDEFDPPIASVWIEGKVAKKLGIDLTQARATMISGAARILSKEEFEQCGKADSDKETMLTFPMPTKRELLEMLAAGDGQRFVASLASQLNLLARFVPLMDELLLKSARP